MVQNVSVQKDTTLKINNALYAQRLFLDASNVMMKIPVHLAMLMISLFPSRMINTNAVV